MQANKPPLQLPLLFFVTIMMLKDRGPRAYRYVKETIHDTLQALVEV